MNYFFVNFGKKSKKKVFTLARRWETFSGKNWKNKYFKCSDFEHYEHTRESFQSPEGIIRCSTQGSEFLSFSCLVATTVVSATAPIATATTTAVTITTAPTAVVTTVTITVIVAVSVLKPQIDLFIPKIEKTPLFKLQSVIPTRKFWKLRFNNAL